MDTYASNVAALPTPPKRTKLLEPVGFRTPPHDIDAEMALLGALLIEPETWPAIDGMLEPDMFYQPGHRSLFAAIAKLAREDRLVDPILLVRAVSGDDAIVSLGGREYLAGLVRVACSSMSAPDYARALRDLYCRRQIIAACEIAETHAYDIAGTDEDWTGIAAKLARRLEDLNGAIIDERIQTFEQVITSLAEKLSNPQPPMGTGLEPLDKSLGGGLRPGLYAFEGQAKRFKSGLLGSIAWQAMRDGTSCLFATLEMFPEDITQRLVGGHARMNYLALENPQYREANVARVWKFKTDHPGAENFNFAHVPGIKIEGMLSLMAKAVAQHRCDLIILDYWQLIGGRHPSMSQAEHLEDTAYRIATFAYNNRLPVVMASQLNRQDDSLGGDGLKRACVWRGKIHKEEMGKDAQGRDMAGIWIEVGENRYGPGGNIGNDKEPAFLIDTGPVLTPLS
jgi:replicative DNA helicase